jgi:hypothetical protein
VWWRQSGWPIGHMETEQHATYGAVVVSIRMCLFLRSWASGRCCRCFSKLLRLSVLRTGERGATSMAVSSEAMVGGVGAYVGSVEGWIVCKQSRGVCGVIYSSCELL